ncbi:hypothetical protein CR513_12542, partial [Mucuna pruriens]
YAWKPLRTPRSTRKSRILRKEFRVSQKVLLFHSRLRLIAGKLHSWWDRPFVVTNVFSYGVVEEKDEASNHTFKVNGHHLKPYHKGPNLSSAMGEVEIITLVELVILEDPPKELITSRSPEKLMIHPYLRGIKEQWNCFGSKIYNKCGGGALRESTGKHLVGGLEPGSKEKIETKSKSTRKSSWPDKANSCRPTPWPTSSQEPTPIRNRIHPDSRRPTPPKARSKHRAQAKVGLGAEYWVDFQEDIFRVRWHIT